MSRTTSRAGPHLPELEGSELLLRGVIGGVPPSSNHLYSGQQRRFITKVGRAYKNNARSELAQQWINEQQPSGDDAHMLILRFFLPAVLNGTYGKKGGASSRFKRIDLSGLIKIVEDVVVEVTGADDASNLALVPMKLQSKREPRVEIELWRLRDAAFLR